MPSPRRFPLTPTNAMAVVALAAMLVAIAGMFFMSGQRLHVDETGADLGPASAPCRPDYEGHPLQDGVARQRDPRQSRRR